MAFNPDVKQPGDLARAQDWNEAMEEVVRLENSKVDNSGDTINGSLNVFGNVLATGYGAKLICHRLLTAPWLDNNATFSNPRSHSLSNDRLDFGKGNEDHEKLFSVNLVPANTLSNNRSYMIKIATAAEALTTDNDLLIGISDGTNVVGFQRLDSNNNDNIGRGMSGKDGNRLENMSWGPLGGAISNTHQWFEIQMRLDDDTWILGKVGSVVTPTAWTSNRTLNRENALFLVAFANDAGEEYGIFSIEVSIMGESPIPVQSSFGTAEFIEFVGGGFSGD